MHPDMWEAQVAKEESMSSGPLEASTPSGRYETQSSATKHTPGPWHWAGVNLLGPHYIDVIDAKVSCGTWCQGGSADLQISDADRALIAAAPDLLEALRNLLAVHEGQGGTKYHAGDIARAAIRRATGEQS